MAKKKEEMTQEQAQGTATETAAPALAADKVLSVKLKGGASVRLKAG